MRSRNHSRKAISNRNRVKRFRNRERIWNNVAKYVNQTQQPTNTTNTEQSDESIPDIQNEKSTKDLLRAWIDYHGITMRAVNDLLKILNGAGEHLTASHSCMNCC